MWWFVIIMLAVLGLYYSGYWLAYYMVCQFMYYGLHDPEGFKKWEQSQPDAEERMKNDKKLFKDSAKLSWIMVFMVSYKMLKEYLESTKDCKFKREKLW